jgi:hypothetical protein
MMDGYSSGAGDFGPGIQENKGIKTGVGVGKTVDSKKRRAADNRVVIWYVTNKRPRSLVRNGGQQPGADFISSELVLPRGCEIVKDQMMSCTCLIIAVVRPGNPRGM